MVGVSTSDMNCALVCCSSDLNFGGGFLVWMQGYWIQVGVGGWNALTDLDFLLQLVETGSSLKIDI